MPAIWRVNYCVWQRANAVSEYRVVPPETPSFPIDCRENFLLNLESSNLDPSLVEAISREIPNWAPNTDRWFEGCGKLVRMTLLRESEQHFVTPDEVLAELIRLKTKGNELFKKCLFEQALEVYDQGVALIGTSLVRRTENDVKQGIIPLYLNKTQCCLKLQRWAEAIAAATEVIELDRNNVKALFRRAVARLENRQIGDARRDLLSVLYVEPKNAEAISKLKEVEKAERGVLPNNFFAGNIPIPPIIRMSFGAEIGHADFELDVMRVPKTVENFLLLVKAKKFTDKAVFKAAKDQFFQSGDYMHNDGSGGDCMITPDREVRGRKFFNDEDLLSVPHCCKGLLGMANYGKNSNGSQFYVTLGTAAQEALDGKHVVFGRIVGSIDALDKINDRCPLNDTDVVLKSIEVIRDISK